LKSLVEQTIVNGKLADKPKARRKITSKAKAKTR
jgi:hypothetical protein